MALVAGMLETLFVGVPKRFVIRDIGDCRVAARNAVRDRWGSVIQILGLNENFADAEKTFLEFRKVNPARQILKFDGEIGVLHLPRQGFFQTALETDRKS